MMERLGGSGRQGFRSRRRDGRMGRVLGGRIEGARAAFLRAKVPGC